MWVPPGKRSHTGVTQETRPEPAHGVLGIGLSVRRLCSDSINLDTLSLNAHEPTIGRTGTHLRRYSHFSVRYSKVVQAKSNQNLLSYCAKEGCAFCRETLLHELTPRSNDVPKRDVAIPSNPRVPSSPCLALRQYYYGETVTFPPHQMLKGPVWPSSQADRYDKQPPLSWTCPPPHTYIGTTSLVQSDPRRVWKMAANPWQ
jgi:hypothetical protein